MSDKEKLTKVCIGERSGEILAFLLSILLILTMGGICAGIAYKRFTESVEALPAAPIMPRPIYNTAERTNNVREARDRALQRRLNNGPHNNHRVPSLRAFHGDIPSDKSCLFGDHLGLPQLFTDSVYCLGVVCLGSELAAANCQALDRAGITHVLSTNAQCALRRDANSRDCQDVFLADNVLEWRALIDYLYMALIWRENERLQYCFSGRCSLTTGVRVFVHSDQPRTHGSAMAIAFLMADDPTLTYDAALEQLRQVYHLDPAPAPLFELTLRLYEVLGLNSRLHCILDFAIEGPKYFDADGQPSKCFCSAEACTALGAVTSQGSYLLPQLWHDRENLMKKKSEFADH